MFSTSLTKTLTLTVISQDGLLSTQHINLSTFMFPDCNFLLGSASFPVHGIYAVTMIIQWRKMKWMPWYGTHWLFYTKWALVPDRKAAVNESGYFLSQLDTKHESISETTRKQEGILVEGQPPAFKQIWEWGRQSQDGGVPKWTILNGRGRVWVQEGFKHGLSNVDSVCPVDRQTDKHANATEDITFPQVILAVGKYRTFAVKIILYKKTGRILPLSGSSFCFRRFHFLTISLSVCLCVLSIRPATITNTLIVHESCLKCVFSTTDIVWLQQYFTTHTLHYIITSSKHYARTRNLSTHHSNFSKNNSFDPI